MIRVEFDTIDDLVAIVAAIRGEGCDLQRLKELIRELNTSTAILINAENKQTKQKGE